MQTRGIEAAGTTGGLDRRELRAAAQRTRRSTVPRGAADDDADWYVTRIRDVAARPTGLAYVDVPVRTDGDAHVVPYVADWR